MSTAAAICVITSARKIANFANAEGVFDKPITERKICRHLGAVIADAVLQAGLNYASVVRPRIHRILLHYPFANNGAALKEIVQNKMVEDFLNWRHPLKISRFEEIVLMLCENDVSDIEDLRGMLLSDAFCGRLRSINGVGPKTVDYMSCLIGVDSIAVDRHIQGFARRAGVEEKDYNYLKNVFSFAADLLSIPRRDLDAWVWHCESARKTKQLVLPLFTQLP